MIPKIALLASLLGLSCACLSEAILESNQSCVDTLDYRDLKSYSRISYKICTFVSGITHKQHVKQNITIYFDVGMQIPVPEEHFAMIQKDIQDSQNPCSAELLESLSNKNASLYGKSLTELYISYVQCSDTPLKNGLNFVIGNASAKIYIANGNRVKLSAEIPRIHSANAIAPSNSKIFEEKLRKLLEDITSVYWRMFTKTHYGRVILQIHPEKDPFLEELKKYAKPINVLFSAEMLETIFLKDSYRQGTVIIQFNPEKSVIAAVVCIPLGASYGTPPKTRNLELIQYVLSDFGKLSPATFINLEKRRIIVSKEGHYIRDVRISKLTDTVIRLNADKVLSEQVSPWKGTMSCQKLKLFQDSLFFSLKRMSSDKTGALVAIQDEEDSFLEGLSEEATILNAKFSSIVFESIFYKKSPLHDGAMYIQIGQNGCTIRAAGLVVPVNETVPYLAIKSALTGTRHKAAVSLSLKTNAFILVVSEESGKLSYAEKGSLFKGKTIAELEQVMNNRFKCNGRSSEEFENH